MDDSDSTLIFFGILIGLLISGAIGAWIARQRGRTSREAFASVSFWVPSAGS